MTRLRFIVLVVAILVGATWGAVRTPASIPCMYSYNNQGYFVSAYCVQAYCSAHMYCQYETCGGSCGTGYSQSCIASGYACGYFIGCEGMGCV